MEHTKHLSKVALILIDLQKSFTVGNWIKYFDRGDNTKLLEAFAKAGYVLEHLSRDIPILCTRCPFHTRQDFDYVDDVADRLKSRKYTEIIKPSARILDYDSQGVAQWLHEAQGSKVDTVVIGGCTTTSCVRQSATQLQQAFSQELGIQFVVDLSLCGARDSNYVARCSKCLESYLAGLDVLCGRCEETGETMMSPVDKAVMDMRKAGLTVIEDFDWSKYFL